MKELPKAYNPQEVEDAIYQKWENGGWFKPEKYKHSKNSSHFSIVMPPPNVTGTLHLGHAVMLAVQDIMVRFNRMRGARTVWIPGTDHASIATQNKVEKKLKDEQGLSRHDLGREKFLAAVEKFVQESKGTIRHQIRKMGSSCDWSREAYTLDEARSLSVRTVFKKMYDDGLIYRGLRLVNWCVRCASTLADDEVEHEEQSGKLYYITYKLNDKDVVSVATTRPETKLGDTGLAVHPEDGRYQKLVGQTFEVNLAGHKITVKVFADKAVDMNFGTGVVGVTPAHSATDAEFAAKHKLASIEVIDEKGKMTRSAGKYAGQKVAEARENFVHDFEVAGLLEKTENIKHNVALCYRCGTTVEPLPSKQWFVAVNKQFKSRLDGRMVTLKDEMLRAVKDGAISIIPDRFNKIYFHWINNLRDWCISRQIWFGHQIPVWYCGSRHITVAVESPMVCEQCSSKAVVFGEAPHPEAVPRSSIIAYVERENGQVLTINWGNRLGGNLLVGGGLKEGENPIDCARREIAEETGFVDLEYIETLPRKITNNYFAASKNVWRTIKITALRFKLKSEKQVSPKLEADEEGKFIVEWTDKNILLRDMREPAHAFVLRAFTGTPHTMTQDTDTLDTWFSSGLWTFSVLGWPKDTTDLKNFHPTSVLETGYDILFFWVARMILMSTYVLGEVPFKNVYLHGLVRDKQGRKMSKSLGNVIDPLEVIAKYGTDAVRLALVVGTTPGNDVKMSEEKIADYRNFTNKLWNISRFVLLNVKKVAVSPKPPKTKTLADRVILELYRQTLEQINDDLRLYQFSAAAEKLRQFTWDTFADWYLEIAKIEKNKDEILLYILANLLKAWHPFMPFVTEELWQYFGRPGQLLIGEHWPILPKVKKSKKMFNDVLHFGDLQSLVQGIRNTRQSFRVEPGRFVEATLHLGRGQEWIKKESETLKGLARLGKLHFTFKKVNLKKVGLAVSASGIEAYIHLDSNLNAEQEVARLKKELNTVEADLSRGLIQLANKDFLKHAKKEVVMELKRRTQYNKGRIKSLKQQIKLFE